MQIQPEPITFDDFIAWYPEKSEYRYELHNGAIVKMPKPTGEHSEISGFLALELGMECRKSQSSYFVPKECLVKPFRDYSGYEPDVIVLDKQALKEEPRWSTSSTITMGKSIPLIVEVVSSNWRNDYYLKAADYEEMGISEYLIVDYRGLGGRRFIGNPKQPTISLYRLIDGEYQVSQYRGNEIIQFSAFPELSLTAEQIFKAGLSL